jgi:hypothetical protein
MALESDARNMPVPKNSSAELQTIVNMASLERDVKKHGAAIMMELHWDCDLDHDVSEGCKPEVKVRRLDSASPLSRGFNFRYVLRGKLRGEVERGCGGGGGTGGDGGNGGEAGGGARRVRCVRRSTKRG